MKITRMVKTPYLGEISAQCIEGASHDDRLEHGLASNSREKREEAQNMNITWHIWL